MSRYAMPVFSLTCLMLVGAFSMGAAAAAPVRPLEMQQQNHPNCRGLRGGDPAFALLGCRRGGSEAQPQRQQTSAPAPRRQQPEQHPSCNGMRRGDPQFISLGCRGRS